MASFLLEWLVGVLWPSGLDDHIAGGLNLQAGVQMFCFYYIWVVYIFPQELMHFIENFKLKSYTDTLWF